MRILLVVFLTFYTSFSYSQEKIEYTILDRDFKRIDYKHIKEYQKTKKFNFNYTKNKIVLKVNIPSNLKKNFILFDILSPGEIEVLNQNGKPINIKKNKYFYPVFDISDYKGQTVFFERIGNLRFDGIIKFQSKAEIDNYKEINLIFTFIFLGASLFLILYHLFYYFATKNKSYLYYTIFNLNYSIVILIFTLFFSYFLKSNWIEENLMIFTAINVFLYNLFAKNFLNFKDLVKPKMLKIINIGEYVILACALLYLFVDGLQFILAPLIDYLVIFLITSVFYNVLKIRKDNIMSYFYLASWGVSMIGVGLLYSYEFSSWTLTEYSFLPRYFILFGCLGEMIGNSFGLSYQMKLLEKDKFLAEIKLKQSKKYKKLLRIVCHDIATPLSSSFLSLSMLKNQLGEENRFVNLTEQSLKKLTELVEHVRESEKEKNNKDFITMQKAYEMLLEDFNAKLEEKNINLLLKGDSETVVPINKTELITNILGNLVSNAIKFSQENSNIIVEVGEKGENILLSCQDSGTGIKQEIIDQIQKGICVTTSGTNGEKGTGLGTQILKELVEEYNGTLDIQSKEDKGTKFLISIPKIINEL